MGLKLYGGSRSHPHGSGFPVRSLQIPARAHLDRWRVFVADDPGYGLQRTGPAFRPGCLLGIGNRSIDRQSGSHHGPRDREINVGWSDHRRRHTFAILRAARIRDSRNANRFRVPACSDGSETGNQRMAHARTHRKARNLYKRISRTHEEEWCSVRPFRNLEGPLLCRFHPVSCCSVRPVLWSVRTNRQAGSYDYSIGPETRLLLLVAVRFAVVLAGFHGNPSSPHRPRSRYRVSCFAAISFWRRGKELAPPTDRCFDGSADRHNPGNTHPPRWIYAMEPTHECMERRPGA